MDDVAISATMLAVSTVMIAVAAHLMRSLSKAGTLQRNRAFGIKTRATLRSDHAWAQGHAAAEPRMLAAASCGYTTAVGSAGLLVLAAYTGLSAVPALVLAMAGFLGTTALILAGGVVGNSAARNARQHSPDTEARQTGS